MFARTLVSAGLLFFAADLSAQYPSEITAVAVTQRIADLTPPDREIAANEFLIVEDLRSVRQEAGALRAFLEDSSMIPDSFDANSSKQQATAIFNAIDKLNCRSVPVAGLDSLLEVYNSLHLLRERLRQHLLRERLRPFQVAVSPELRQR